MKNSMPEPESKDLSVATYRAQSGDAAVLRSADAECPSWCENGSVEHPCRGEHRLQWDEIPASGAATEWLLARKQVEEDLGSWRPNVTVAVAQRDLKDIRDEAPVVCVNVGGPLGEGEVDLRLDEAKSLVRQLLAAIQVGERRTPTSRGSGHEPWCTSHVDAGPEVGPVGWCTTKDTVNGVEIGLVGDVEALGGAGGVEIYDAGDNFMTAAKAREVAGALLVAAGRLDGRTDTTNAVTRNLALALATAGPFNVNAIEQMADALNVDIVNVVTFGVDAP